MIERVKRSEQDKRKVGEKIGLGRKRRMTYHRNSSKKQKGVSKVGKGSIKRKRTREGIKGK